VHCVGHDITRTHTQAAGDSITLLPVRFEAQWFLLELDNRGSERVVRWYGVLTTREHAVRINMTLRRLLAIPLVRRGWGDAGDEIDERGIEQDRAHDSGVWLLVALWHVLRERRTLPPSVFVYGRTRRSLLRLAVHRDVSPLTWLPTMMVRPENDAVPTAEQSAYSDAPAAAVAAPPTTTTSTTTTSTVTTTTMMVDEHNTTDSEAAALSVVPTPAPPMLSTTTVATTMMVDDCAAVSSVVPTTPATTATATSTSSSTTTTVHDVDAHNVQREG